MSDASRAAARRWPRPLDVVGALVVVGIVVLGTTHMEWNAADPARDWLAYACGVTGAASLVFWRRWPLAVSAVAAVMTGVYVARSYPDGPALLPGPLALLALGYQAPRRISWVAAAAYIGSALTARTIGSDEVDGDWLAVVGVASAAVLAGQAIAARGERAAAQRERLAHQQERAIAAERLRLAQDLHDSVAHAMATINVQSGVAAHLLDRDPSQA